MQLFLKNELLRQTLLVKSNLNLATGETVQSVKPFPHKKEDMAFNPKVHIKPGVKSPIYNQVYLWHCGVFIQENIWKFKGQRMKTRSVPNKVQGDGRHQGCSLISTHTVAHPPKTHKYTCIYTHIVETVAQVLRVFIANKLL